MQSKVIDRHLIVNESKYRLERTLKTETRQVNIISMSLKYFQFTSNIT